MKTEIVYQSSSYINGQWSASDEKITLKNPANLSSNIKEIYFASPQNAKKSILSADVAFANWKSTSIDYRIGLLKELMSSLEKNKKSFSHLITLENGKTIKESMGEVDAAILEGNYQIEFLMHNLYESIENNKLYYEPLGVVLLITPWNFPLSTVIRKMIPALICGNTIVLKPSEFSSLTSIFLFELIDNISLPNGVANLVLGEGSVVGPSLMESSALKIVSFTGSTDTGESIQNEIGSNDIRYQAEMGGSNALVIWDDAEIEKAVEATVASGMACAGQWCTGISKLVIHENIYDNVMRSLVKAVKNINVGDGSFVTTDMGPLNNLPQFNKMKNYIERAVEQGAEVIIGGESIKSDNKDGYFFSPTLLGNVNDKMEIASEEIFGPIINIFKTKDIESAISFSNLGKYGLSFSIYTADNKIAETFIKEIDASLCHVNLPTPYRDVAMPFSGWKQSGKGIPESGRFARDAFTKPKVVYSDNS